MKSRKFFVVILVICLLLALEVGLSQAQSSSNPPPGNTDGKQNEETAGDATQPASDTSLTGDLSYGFYYQGTLTEGGVPVNGVRQMEFKLFDASSGGVQVGATSTQNVTVIRGQFSVTLSWGASEFDGRALWLAVQAKDSGGIWRDLGRRQILAVPYAMSLMPGANIKAQTSFDGIYVSGPWDGIHLVSSASDGNHGAVYARAISDTGVAIAGNFATSSVDGFGVLAYNASTGIGVAGFQSGYDASISSSWWGKPGGLFGGAFGVSGVSKYVGGFGVHGQYQATSGGGAAVLGENVGSPNAWAGNFWSLGNGVTISAGSGKTGLSVSGGSKSAVVRTDDGSRLLYTEESTEVWFTDYGFGKLVDGAATITIDPVFAQTVNLKEPYHVFVQAYGDADIYVTNRTSTGFEVHLRSGDTSVEFSYRLVARRLGFETQRLERAPWADADTNLYPEKAGAMGSLKPPDAATP